MADVAGDADAQPSADHQATAPQVSPWPTGREVVHAALAESVQHLVVHLPIARAGADPEGVHQCRVAARRLRSDLRTFRPVLDPNWAQGLKRDLGAFAGGFGPVRDDDVLLDALQRIDAAPALLTAIDDERHAHRRTLLALLDSEATGHLVDALIDAAADPITAPQADDPADDLMRPLARKPWTRLQRAVDALGRAPSDEDLHRVRLLAKHCRYASMAVAPAFGPPALAFAKALGKVQNALGERNDVRVMSDRLLEVSARLDPAAAFAAGVAVGKLQAQADADPDAWRRAWKKASAKDLSQWL